MKQIKDLVNTIEGKCKIRDNIVKELKENKYPKAVYRYKLKELSKINTFFSKYGRDIF
ncbi:TPA: hypothetical protein LA460_000096 [Clostridium botulinum]|nr:hypothetical protein [Clostridium botulinum]